MSTRKKLLEPYKVGLFRQKRSERDIKYASLHRRMMAASIDSILLSLVFGGVIDSMLASVYGVQMDLTGLQAQVQALGDDKAAIHKLIVEALQQSHFVARVLINLGVQMIIFSVYNAVCWMVWSSSPGKMLFGLKVVDADSEKKLSFKQAIIRAIGYIPSGVCLGIGFFWISHTKRRQGWHDKWARTVVINRPKKKKSDQAV